MSEDGLSRRQRRDMMQLRDDLRSALGDPAMRRVLVWVLQLTGVYAPSYTGGDGTYYREGKRSVGLQLIAGLTDVDPMAYVELLRDTVAQQQDRAATAQEHEGGYADSMGD